MQKEKRIVKAELKSLGIEGSIPRIVDTDVNFSWDSFYHDAKVAEHTQSEEDKEVILKQGNEIVEKYIGKKNFLTAFLGAGMAGPAFKTKIGGVYKFTSEGPEAGVALAMGLLFKKLTTQARIFKVYELALDGDRFWIIDKELVEPLRDYLEDEKADGIIGEVVDLLSEQHKSYDVFRKKLLDVQGEDGKIFKMLFARKPKFMQTIFEFYTNLKKDEETLQTRLADTHAGNIGMRGDRVLCFDCVYRGANYSLKKGGSMAQGGNTQIDEYAIRQWYRDNVVSPINSVQHRHLIEKFQASGYVGTPSVWEKPGSWENEFLEWVKDNNDFSFMPKKASDKAKITIKSKFGEKHDQVWYLAKMGDSTHFYLSNSADEKGGVYHIGQMRDEPYYNDLASWLKGGIDIDGKNYPNVKGYAKGGQPHDEDAEGWVWDGDDWIQVEKKKGGKMAIGGTFEGNEDDGYTDEDLHQMYDWKAAGMSLEPFSHKEQTGLIAESLGFNKNEKGLWVAYAKGGEIRIGDTINYAGHRWRIQGKSRLGNDQVLLRRTHFRADLKRRGQVGTAMDVSIADLEKKGYKVDLSRPALHTFYKVNWLKGNELNEKNFDTPEEARDYAKTLKGLRDTSGVTTREYSKLDESEVKAYLGLAKGGLSKRFTGMKDLHIDMSVVVDGMSDREVADYLKISLKEFQQNRAIQRERATDKMTNEKFNDYLVEQDMRKDEARGLAKGGGIETDVVYPFTLAGKYKDYSEESLRNDKELISIYKKYIEPKIKEASEDGKYEMNFDSYDLLKNLNYPDDKKWDMRKKIINYLMLNGFDAWESNQSSTIYIKWYGKFAKGGITKGGKLEIVKIVKTKENDIVLDVKLNKEVVRLNFKEGELIDDDEDDRSFIYSYVAEHNNKWYEVDATFYGNPNTDLNFGDILGDIQEIENPQIAKDKKKKEYDRMWKKQQAEWKRNDKKRIAKEKREGTYDNYVKGEKVHKYKDKSGEWKDITPIELIVPYTWSRQNSDDVYDSMILKEFNKLGYDAVELMNWGGDARLNKGEDIGYEVGYTFWMAGEGFPEHESESFDDLQEAIDFAKKKGGDLFYTKYFDGKLAEKGKIELATGKYIPRHAQGGTIDRQEKELMVSNIVGAYAHLKKEEVRSWSDEKLIAWDSKATKVWGKISKGLGMAKGGTMASGGEIRKGLRWKNEWTDAKGVVGYDILEVVDISDKLIKSIIVESSKPERVGHIPEEETKSEIRKIIAGKYPFAYKMASGGGVGDNEKLWNGWSYEQKMEFLERELPYSELSPQEFTRKFGHSRKALADYFAQLSWNDPALAGVRQTVIDYTRRNDFDELRKKFPFIGLAEGGSLAGGGRHFVGNFTEEQLKRGEDKILIEKAKKETGLQYIDSKIIKRKGITYLETYLYSLEDYMKDPKALKMSSGGSMETGGGVSLQDYEKELQILKMQRVNALTDVDKYRLNKRIREIENIIEHRKETEKHIKASGGSTMATGGETQTELTKGEQKLLSRFEVGRGFGVYESYIPLANSLVKKGLIIHREGTNSYYLPTDEDLMKKHQQESKQSKSGSMATGGGLKANDLPLGTWLKHIRTGAKAKVWNVNPETGRMQLEDIYGNKNNMWRFANDWEITTAPKKEEGGEINADNITIFYVKGDEAVTNVSTSLETAEQAQGQHNKHLADSHGEAHIFKIEVPKKDWDAGKIAVSNWRAWEGKSYEEGGSFDHEKFQNDELQASGFDVLKLTESQKGIILMPSHAPENYMMDGEISRKQAFSIWKNKLASSGLSPADIKRAVNMHFKAHGGEMTSHIKSKEHRNQ